MGIDRSTIAKSPSGRLRVQMASNRLVAMIVIAVVCVALGDEAFEWRKDAWSCSSTSLHREACVGEIGGAGIAAERALKLFSDELGESGPTQKASIFGYLSSLKEAQKQCPASRLQCPSSSENDRVSDPPAKDKKKKTAKGSEARAKKEGAKKKAIGSSELGPFIERGFVGGPTETLGKATSSFNTSTEIWIAFKDASVKGIAKAGAVLTFDGSKFKRLVSPQPVKNGMFGSAMVLWDKDTVLIGAPNETVKTFHCKENVRNGCYYGAVYVKVKGKDTMQRLVSPNTAYFRYGFFGVKDWEWG